MAVATCQLSAGDAFSFAECLALVTADLRGAEVTVAHHILVDEGQDFFAMH
ncbi:hypothetical protein [Timonella senegalensis]|uniref:hypothetical protein n=1 Tax=Timonella senegalensis TaxID=1465825 RepID=UPI0028AB4D33|nr:hypothetical protein [Timonella senegalensis]